MFDVALVVTFWFVRESASVQSMNFTIAAIYFEKLIQR